MAPRTLRLPSGLCLPRPAAMLRAKFSEWAYENYDGYRPDDPDCPGPKDIEIVYQLGARSSKDAYRRLLQKSRREVRAALERLPTSRALESSSLKSIRSPFIDLIDLCCATKGIKLAGATKLLALFRPSIIPVMDSVVDSYYWYATSITDVPRFRTLARHDTWGTYAFELLCLMREDIRGARAPLDSILRDVRHEPFGGISRLRVLESLIWYHYARGDAPRPLSDP